MIRRADRDAICRDKIYVRSIEKLTGKTFVDKLARTS
jgi:hypothetical protein